MDCLFCNIVENKINADILHQDDKIMAFRDINPQAPEHVLIIPKSHIPTINDLATQDNNLVGNMILLAKDLAKKLQLNDDGYRLIFNVNSSGGQEVYHIHLHLLGGRQMKWPPG